MATARRPADMEATASPAAIGGTPSAVPDADMPSGVRRHPKLPELTRGELYATHEKELAAAIEAEAFIEWVSNEKGQVDYRIVHHHFRVLLARRLFAWGLPEATVRGVTDPFRGAAIAQMPSQRRALDRFDAEVARHHKAHPFDGTEEVRRFDQRYGEGRFGDLSSLEVMVRHRLGHRKGRKWLVYGPDRRGVWTTPEILRGHRGITDESLTAYIEAMGRWLEKSARARKLSDAGKKGGRSNRGTPRVVKDGKPQVNSERELKQGMITLWFMQHQTQTYQANPHPYTIARELRAIYGDAAPSPRFVRDDIDPEGARRRREAARLKVKCH